MTAAEPDGLEEEADEEVQRVSSNCVCGCVVLARASVFV